MTQNQVREKQPHSISGTQPPQYGFDHDLMKAEAGPGSSAFPSGFLSTSHGFPGVSGPCYVIWPTYDFPPGEGLDTHPVQKAGGSWVAHKENVGLACVSSRGLHWIPSLDGTRVELLRSAEVLPPT